MTRDGRLLVCSPSPRVMTGPGGVWLLGSENGSACSLQGASGELVLALLFHARTPRSAESLARAVLEEAGEGRAEPPALQVVDEAIALLARLGVLIEPRGDDEPSRPGPAGNVVLAVTGAIGAVHAPRLVQSLLRAGHDVRVVMTRAARRFVAPRAFEALTHRRVELALWRGSAAAPSPHVEIARWADAVLVCPCTATSLARIAAADCSELVSAVATTTRAPVLLVPSMNLQMLRAPLVEKNLETVREAGFFVAHSGHGHEVADAPDDRVLRAGAATPVANIVRWLDLLLSRVQDESPRLSSRAEWDAEHERGTAPAVAASVDDDLSRALDHHAATPSRVIDVGTGLGEIARAAARRGHVVVATDFSAVAIRRAQAIEPDVPVTWLVDDMTESALHATFDLCVDRACLGCVPVARRARYLAQVAAWVRPGGIWILKAHRGPLASLRAHGFTPDEVREMTAPSFDLVGVEASSLSFGAWRDRPSWTLTLERRVRQS